MNSNRASSTADESPIIGVLESCLYATDLDACERFYTAVLGLHVITRERGRHVFFRCGEGVFLLFNAERTGIEQTHIGESLIPMHGSTGSGHLAFRVRADGLDQWRERLSLKQIPIESEVSWPKGGHSIYFRDPAGNSIELATASLWGIEEVPRGHSGRDLGTREAR